MNPASQHLDYKLLDYAYGELSEGEAKTVEAHLRACPQCADSLTAMKQVRRTMSQLPIAAAPQAGLESLLAYAQKAAETARARPARRRTWLRWIAPLASVVALSLVLVVSSKVVRRPEATVALPLDDTRGDWESVPRLLEKKEAESPAKARVPAKADKTLAEDSDAPPKVFEPASQWARPPKEWKGAGTRAAPQPSAPPQAEHLAQQADRLSGAGEAAAPKPERARRAAAPADDDAARGSARDEKLQAGVERRPARGSASNAIPGGVVGGIVGGRQADADKSKSVGGARARESVEGVASTDSFEAPQPPKVASQHAAGSVEAKQTSSALRGASSAPSSTAERPIDREREVTQLRQALAAAQGQERARLLRQLCDALDALGRTHEADSACDAVVREFPASEEAKSALERLKVRAAEP